MPRTLFEKVWDAHVVRAAPGEPSLLYIDLHLIHEVTSPDHNVPTTDRNLPIADPIAARQIETLRHNCGEFGIKLFDIDSNDQGIVHVIGPELGLTQPGMTIVCGDSHTSTHGAFGALAFGIGTSEVEHVMATQCLPQSKPRTLLINVRGALSEGVTAKDLALGIIGQIGTDGATGHVIEYAGAAVRALSMEGRMTLCNMSIEAGARAGMIAPDETTFSYLKGRRYAPDEKWEEAVRYWRTLPSDDDAQFDQVVNIDATTIAPCVTWGTNPGMVVPVTGAVPDPSNAQSEAERRAFARALEYMALQPRMRIADIAIDRVFIGSCTNSRLEDLRAAARVIKGHQVHNSVRTRTFCSLASAALQPAIVTSKDGRGAVAARI